jgi:hypothetical protein
MRVVHVYCVMPAGSVPDPGVQGVGDAAVRVIETAGLAFWVSEHDRRPAAGTEAATAHHRVVAAGMNSAVTPVPVRFGQWFAGEDAAAAALAADGDRWRDLLQRFAGHCEWGVRITGFRPARDMHNARAQTGTAYMVELARRTALSDERRSAAERVAQQVARQLGSLAADTRVEHTAAGDVLSLCHLVAWNDADAYHTRVRAAGDEQRPLHFLFTGPLPPYSFVE